MGEFKSFWIIGFERWGGLRPLAMENRKARWKPLFYGLWIRVPKS